VTLPAARHPQPIEVVSTASDDPDFASVHDAIRAALPLLAPFIRRAYRAMQAGGDGTPAPPKACLAMPTEEP
jgi:hypothetical protein